MAQSDERSLSPGELSAAREDPLTDLRTRTRREQILRAAAAAFADQGFHRAKVRDVADRAGLAEGTIYNYFASKDELLLALLDAVNETPERPEAFAAAAAEAVPSFVRAYVRKRFTDLEPHLDVLRPILSELLVDADLRERYLRATVEPTLELAERYFARKIEAGEIAAVDPGLLARAMAAQVFGLAVLRLLGDARLDAEWDAVGELVADLLVAGLEAERRS